MQTERKIKDGVLEQIYKKLPIIELAAVLLILLALVLRLSTITGILLTSMAIIYFLTAYRRSSNKKESTLYIILPKILGIAWSIVTVGIMYYLLVLPGYEVMLQAGSLALLTVITGGLMITKGNLNKIGKDVVIRSLILSGLGLFFLYTNITLPV